MTLSTTTTTTISGKHLFAIVAVVSACADVTFHDSISRSQFQIQVRTPFMPRTIGTFYVLRDALNAWTYYYIIKLKTIRHIRTT